MFRFECNQGLRAQVVRGFTLVELMVVIAIIAIISAVAAPMYTTYVKKVRSDEGQAALADIKAKQELYRSTRFKYASSLKDLSGFKDEQSKHGDYYLVEIESADQNSFVARAWDGQKAISGELGGEEWKITQDLDKPCHTKSTLYDGVDPCVAENGF